MTRTPLSRSKGHQADLLTAVLKRQAASAMGVGTCWPWETAVMLPSARRREALRRLRGGEGRGHAVAASSDLHLGPGLVPNCIQPFMKFHRYLMSTPVVFGVIMLLPLCSRLRPDVRDRQTSDRQTDVRRASSPNDPLP